MKFWEDHKHFHMLEIWFVYIYSRTMKSIRNNIAKTSNDFTGLFLCTSEVNEGTQSIEETM